MSVFAVRWRPGPDLAQLRSHSTPATRRNWFNQIQTKVNVNVLCGSMLLSHGTFSIPQI